MQRLIRTIHYNYFLYAAAAVVLLYAATSPVIAGPILNFLFAGIVPGTDYVLSPDAAMMTATITLGLLAVIGLLVLLRHSIRQRGLSTPADPGIVATSVSRPRTHPSTSTNLRSSAAPVAAPAVRLPAIRIPSASLLRTFRPFEGRLVAAIGWLLNWYFYTCARGASVLQLALLRFIRLLTMIVIYDVLAGTALLRSAARLARSGGLASAHWLYPRARRLDSWLEIQCRALLAWSRLWLLRFETTQVLNDIIRESRRSLRNRFK